MRIALALAAALGAGLAPVAALAQAAPIIIGINAANPRPSRPTAPINTLHDFAQALRGCWSPPPLDRDRAPVDVIFQVSFKRSGELFGKPRVIQFNGKVTPAERAVYYTKVAEALDLCSSLPFTEAMGGSAAGRVFRITFLDLRNKKQAEVSWLTTTS